MSRIRFYSMGIVAENKALDSDIVEVSPVEELPFLDGEITDDAQEITVSNVNKDGRSSSNTAYITNTIPAKWLPIAGGNRVTPPDVRRGAVVMLYQMADEKKYYWTTLTNDLKLRKLETVLYAFSATQDEAADVNGDNYYYLEISTHTKSITFHTSKADGEPFSYDVQINTKDGRILITDDVNNYILLDSKQKQVRMENTDGCFFEILGKDCNLNIVNDWNITVGGNVNRSVTGSVNEDTGGSHSNKVSDSFNVESSSNTLSADVNILDAPANTIQGNFSVERGRGGSVGNGQIQGRFDFLDDIDVRGTLTAEKIITPNPIDAPNVL